MKFEQRISLVTLSASDPERLARFYDALGWRRVETPDGIIAYDLIGQALGIYARAKLAEDMGLEADALGSGAATLSHNVASRHDVDALMARALTAGAQILRTASEVFWGGYVGYFADPEGHIWEIAHNPHSTLGPKGEFRWNGFG